jgi:hypothetical protein
MEESMSVSNEASGVQDDGVDAHGNPPVSGATWVEPYDRAGIHVSGYWRGPNGEKIQVEDSGSHSKSDRLAPLDKKYDPDAAKRAAETVLREAKANRKPRAKSSPRRSGGGAAASSVKTPAGAPDGFNRITSISELNSTDHINVDEAILEPGSSPESYSRDLADVKQRLKDSSEDSVDKDLEERKQYLIQDNQKMDRIIDAAQAYAPDDIKKNQRIAKNYLLGNRAKLTALEKSSAIMDTAGDEDGRILALNQARNIHPKNFIDPMYINAIARHDAVYAEALQDEAFEVKSVEPVGNRVKFTFRGQKPGSYYPTQEWSQSVPKDQVNPDGIGNEIHDTRNTIKLLSSYTSYNPSNDARGFNGRMTDAVNLAKASRNLGGSMTYEDIDPSIDKRFNAIRGAKNHIKFNEANEGAYYKEVTDRMLKNRSSAEHDAARLVGMNGMKKINVRDERIIRIEKTLSSYGGRPRVIGMSDADHYLVESESDPDYLQAEYTRGLGSAHNDITRSVVNHTGAVQSFRGSNEDIPLRWRL